MRVGRVCVCVCPTQGFTKWLKDHAKVPYTLPKKDAKDEDKKEDKKAEKEGKDEL